MSMKKVDQKAAFTRIIEFYEKMVKESLDNKDFDNARNWYHEMNGAFFLAGRLGIIDYTTSATSEWFKRIQEAQYGRSGGAQV